MKEHESNAAPRRGCAASLGLLVLVPATGLGFAWASWGLSWWSGALALGLLLLTSGLFVVHSRRGLAQRVLAAGALWVLGPWLVRVALVRGSEQTRLTTLPEDSGPRLLSRVYPESDGTLAAASVLRLTQGIRDPEAGKLGTILKEAYERTEPSAATMPTPAIATYLGLQSAKGFDTFVLRPPEQRVAADGALVFLHGYAGNFYVYCWEAAQAAAAANLLTLCPSLGASGAWWEPSGEATLLATLDYAHAIGMNRIYLAGVSSGAAGASELALKHRARLKGLVLISGMRAQQPPALPVLIVQGTADQMMPASLARAYAKRDSAVSYRELPGGHLIFLSDHQRVRSLIAQFLGELERRATALPSRR